MSEFIREMLTENLTPEKEKRKKTKGKNNSMRSFEFARKNGEKMYPNARLPEYQTTHSAGADFFCAEEVVIPSIWKTVLSDDEEDIKPTLIHTGIKANMEEDEVLIIANRSSNPKKTGLILANSIGVIDADYYSNEDNDGEIMFAFYNYKKQDVVIHVGDRIGQGMFQKVLRPKEGLCVKDDIRAGGFGSTNK